MVIKQGSQFIKVIKFQVIYRFCPGQKCNFPGYIVDNFGTKKADTNDILNSLEYKTWKRLSQYDIEILDILTFQDLSRFSAKFLVLSRFSHILGQIPGNFWTWTDKIQISRFSRFTGSAGNPVKENVHDLSKSHYYGIITIETMRHYSSLKQWGTIVTSQWDTILF